MQRIDYLLEKNNACCILCLSHFRRAISVDAAPRKMGTVAFRRGLIVVCLAAIALSQFAATALFAQRQMEYLDRGVVAVTNTSGDVLVSWRLLATDPADIAFHVYRSSKDAEPRRITGSTIKTATCFIDKDVPPGTATRYHVATIVAEKEQSISESSLSSLKPYFSIPLQTPDGYRPNDASIGDLDGDGQYEIVLHQAGTRT